MAFTKIAIDLGTSNTRIGIVGKGIIVDEPTVVAVSLKEKRVLAYGREAKEMMGKVPSDIEARKPIKHGVIASYKLTESLLHYFLNRALGRIRFVKPVVMISVPVGITSVEERAVIEAAVQAGAGKVYLIPEPIAAAIGSRIPISSSEGNMIVNLGAGTSEIAVLSMNGIVTFESKRVAGDAVNEAVVNYIRKRYGLVIGEQMAEKIKLKIGDTMLSEDPMKMEIRGRDGATGMPNICIINSNDLLEGIKPSLNQIIAAIKSVLEKTPPELASDIIDRGMVLSGGTSLLRNIDELFTKAIGVPAHVVEEPQNAVIKGLIEALQHIDSIQRSLKEGF